MKPVGSAISLDFAPGATLSATIADFSASLQRRRRGVPVRTSTRRKLCHQLANYLAHDPPAQLTTADHAIAVVRCKVGIRLFQLPTSCCVRRRAQSDVGGWESPRHMTVLPGGGSLARAR